MKKIFAFVLSIIMAAACMAACSPSNPAPASDADGKTVKVGICNYVDDASLNQIVENIQARLKEIGDEKGVAFDVSYDNCNADANLLTQIISNFIADDVDIMIGVATPVAMAMQAATEDNGIPVVFAAVSDPVGAGLVESMEAPDVKNIALLYDIGQDSSTAAIAHAKEYLDANGIAYGEYTGTTVDEVTLAVQALIADGVDAVFTPTDNTIMKSELSIYEMLQEAGIPHYTGADSFALNGAFLGYGVDYAALGVETASMAADIALDGAKPAETAVKTFDNGCATINTETCEKLGFNYDEICKAFEPFCTKIQSIVTAESFDEVK